MLTITSKFVQSCCRLSGIFAKLSFWESVSHCRTNHTTSDGIFGNHIWQIHLNLNWGTKLQNWKLETENMFLQLSYGFCCPNISTCIFNKCPRLLLPLPLESTHLHEVCSSVWMCKFEQVSESDSVGQWGRELDKLLALKVKSVGVEHAQFGWAGEEGRGG